MNMWGGWWSRGRGGDEDFELELYLILENREICPKLRLVSEICRVIPTLFLVSEFSMDGM